MADFIEAYPPARKPDGSLPRYVYVETPNGDYYVGYDMAVCRHPQNLLVTGMAGRPLTQLHGAPLRLHTPTKYGYKQIKRIGLIAYTDVKPDDYWTKLGYDWYARLVIIRLAHEADQASKCRLDRWHDAMTISSRQVRESTAPSIVGKAANAGSMFYRQSSSRSAWLTSTAQIMVWELPPV
jgi:hypothetical protein